MGGCLSRDAVRSGDLDPERLQVIQQLQEEETSSHAQVTQKPFPSPYLEELTAQIDSLSAQMQNASGPQPEKERKILNDQIVEVRICMPFCFALVCFAFARVIF